MSSLRAACPLDGAMVNNLPPPTLPCLPI
uniref:Uncharacterized protein n=1 Tax=Arundo donax TaxID=35708 RepID=A0A0A9FHA1_ARUDO